MTLPPSNATSHRWRHAYPVAPPTRVVPCPHRGPCFTGSACCPCHLSPCLRVWLHNLCSTALVAVAWFAACRRQSNPTPAQDSPGRSGCRGSRGCSCHRACRGLLEPSSQGPFRGVYPRQSGRCPSQERPASEHSRYDWAQQRWFPISQERPASEHSRYDWAQQRWCPGSQERLAGEHSRRCDWAPLTQWRRGCSR